MEKETSSPPGPSVSSVPSIPSVKPARASLKPWIGLCLLVAALGLALGVYAWQLLNDTQAQLAKQSKEFAEFKTGMQAQSTQTLAQLKVAQEAAFADKAKLAALETKLAETTTQQSQLDKLTKDLAKNRDEWDLVEIEQGIRLAATHLQLTANTGAALTLLREADARLARLNQAAQSPLRKLLAKDIEKLSTLGVSDVVSLAAQLDQQIAIVDTLRVKGSALAAVAVTKPASKPEAAVQSRWGGWLQDLSQLIQIRRIDASDASFASPEQQEFAKENLKLRLASARFALLSRNDALAKSELERALELLKKAFDAEDAKVKSLQDVFTRWKALPSNELPTLNDSLAAIQALRQARPQTNAPRN